MTRSTHHVAVASRDARAGHGPEEGVHGARLGAEKVPSRVMSSRRLGDFAIRARLNRVN